MMQVGLDVIRQNGSRRGGELTQQGYSLLASSRVGFFHSDKTADLMRSRLTNFSLCCDSVKSRKAR